MFAFLLMFGVAGQDVVPVATEQVTVERLVLEVPDEIAPAAMPYLACKLASAGSPLRDSKSKRQFIPEGVKEGSDCTAFRSRAQREATRLLARQSRLSRDQRSALVAKTLNDIDQYAASLRSKKPSVVGTEQSEIAGLPVDVEPEAMKALAAYQECLHSHLRGAALSPDNIASLFENALQACGERRAQAITVAEQALAEAGWPADRRRRSVEATFTQADESWRVSGRRLHEMMSRLDSQAPASKPNE